MRMTTDARSPRLDLLTWPVIGPFLKWRHARTAMQIPIFLLASLMIFDGLVGPQLAPKNLATVGVVAALPRAGGAGAAGGGQPVLHGVPLHAAAAGRLVAAETAGRRGPAAAAALRNKWLAIGLVVRLLLLSTSTSACGPRPGGPPGWRWPTSPSHSPSTRSSAAPRSANTSARWASSTSSARSSRRWRSRCGAGDVCDVPHEGLHPTGRASSRSQSSSGHRMEIAPETG